MTFCSLTDLKKFLLNFIKTAILNITDINNCIDLCSASLDRIKRFNNLRVCCVIAKREADYSANCELVTILLMYSLNK